MPDLELAVLGAKPVPFAASPSLAISLQIRARGPERSIRSISLSCQVRIEPVKRACSNEEQAGLVELFGEPSRWGTTVPPSFLWTHAYAQVGAFEETTQVDLPVPCSFDFSAGAAKYFYALKEGEVPLLLLFSGPIFYAAPDGALQVSRVPWSQEVAFRLPVQVWKQTMDHYHPNSAVLRLRRDLFDRLHAVKIQQGLPTFDGALEWLLDARGSR